MTVSRTPEIKKEENPTACLIYQRFKVSRTGNLSQECYRAHGTNLPISPAARQRDTSATFQIGNCRFPMEAWSAGFWHSLEVAASALESWRGRTPRRYDGRRATLWLCASHLPRGPPFPYSPARRRRRQFAADQIKSYLYNQMMTRNCRLERL